MWQGEHIINGKGVSNVRTFYDVNPATEEVLGIFPDGRPQIIEDAVEAARKAFPDWKSRSRIYRSDLFYNLCKVMERHREKFVKIVSLETGKSLNEANAEVVESLHMCQWLAGQGREPYGDWMSSEIAGKDAYVMRKPRGVVAAISPWNFCANIGAFWQAGPALLEGNTVVHKPSELTPYSSQFAVKLYQEAGFPDGVYNLVHGDGDTGWNLVNADHVKSILFTGSSIVGRKIRSACANVYDRICSTETGSKSAIILFEDGNQDLALEVMIASAFKLSGQRCVSASRLLIQRSVFDSFVDKFVNKASELTVGCPFETPAPYMGPLISENQRQRVDSYNILTEEVDILLQGKMPERKGFFLTPHVYKTEWGNHPFLRDEVFGPHVALIPFNDISDAIRIYNDTEYGLALGVVTDDFRKMRVMREECNAGMFYMNGGSIGAESHFPFGGINKSGNGYKAAAGAYRAVTDEIVVTVNHDVKMKWAQGMTS